MASSDETPLYAGFDLGTTNSAAAVFDGDHVTVVRNGQGGTLTPSVVRLDRQGRVTTGQRARRFLEQDPDNTSTEFKRLMGTGRRHAFPDAGVSRLPEELAAEILRSLRTDIQDQLGVAPERAVISVPALFELPQSAATSEAARLAGFERVELIQEPIASALAAGWRADDDGGGSWLVYDLGGGTFDVSLLETRDGLLRVVGHDGDNFLGGRDFDWVIAEHLAARLAAAGAPALMRSNPAHAAALRVLKHAAEDAKIELSRTGVAQVTLAQPLLVDGTAVEVDLALERGVVEALCAPLVERSLEVCRRLLGSHGLAPGQLIRLVLVGGPTVMPALRKRVIEVLEAPAAEGLDPMTLVAQGAALYAASARLDGRPASTATPQPSGRRVWLQYPAVSSDLSPHVIGRFVGGAGGGSNGGDPTWPARIRLVRHVGQGIGPWLSTDASVGPDGGWLATVDLVPRKTSSFRIEAFAADGRAVETVPASFSIVQGVTIGDPPLSRTIGVALASGAVQVYFERGAPLPARRTFTHHTIETIARGSRDSVARIPIVQGELEEAHLCRLVGTLEIGGAAIRDTVPMGALVELTLELDRGGRLSARALIPAIDQVFESVAHLLVPDADPAALEASLQTMRRQLMELRTEAFRAGAAGSMEALDRIEARLGEAERDIDAGHGGDADAAQKARRTLLEADASLAELEMTRKWPELEDSARSAVAFASDAVSSWGSDAERQLLDEVIAAVARARAQKDPIELQRQLRLVRRIGNSAFNRNPEVWELYFELAASHASQATDLISAQRLVREGRDAMGRGDRDALRRVVKGLWKLEPPSVQGKRLGYDSGVR